MLRQRSTYQRMIGLLRRPWIGRPSASTLEPPLKYWANYAQRLREGDPAGSVFPDDSDDHALDQDVPLLEPHRLHGCIRRLEANPSACLAVKLLDGRFAAVDQGDDH